MSADGARREWTASVNGTELRVEEEGAGAETVVFSPALFTNRELFDPVMAALRGEYRCIRYDHRGQCDSGFGAPQPSRHLLSTEALYEDDVPLLDQLGVETCHRVGASIGGLVGMRLAARQPDRVRSLIGPSIRHLPRADLRRVAMLGWAVRLSHPLGRVGVAVRRRMTDRVIPNVFGAAFVSDPTRQADREAWRQRYSAQLVPKAVPMIREVFGHPGTAPELLARIEAPTLASRRGQPALRGRPRCRGRRRPRGPAGHPRFPPHDEPGGRAHGAHRATKSRTDAITDFIRTVT